MSISTLCNDSIELLKKMVGTPSLSRNEEQVADVIREFLSDKSIPFHTLLNNTWCRNKYWDDNKPVILLDSHIDTVKPVSGWTYDPFKATMEGDKLIGLGSNDAGGPLVSLLALFRYFYEEKELPFNLIFGATAEEESSGLNGVALMVKEWGHIDFAIVGEPTQMKLAVAERGLVVVDCISHGKAGHAARNEGINSIYIALDDIEKIRNFNFEKVSPILGKIKMTVTQIEAGVQHNVIPDECKFVIDIRTNELYSNADVVAILGELIQSEVKPRSLRLNSSRIDLEHPFVKRAHHLNIESYGSPTMSDQSLMSFPSVKIGPGDSARSHTADEYIYLQEIKNGIELYIELLTNLKL